MPLILFFELFAMVLQPFQCHFEEANHLLFGLFPLGFFYFNGDFGTLDELA